MRTDDTTREKVRPLPREQQPRRKPVEERDHGTCPEHWVRLRPNGTCDLCG